MNKIKSLLSIFAILLVAVSCEEETYDPVIKYGDGPVLTSSEAGGETFLLTEEEADNELFSFSWTQADFGFPAAITYALEIDDAGNSFAGASEIASSSGFSYNITVGELNSLLTSLEYPTGTETPLEIRVKASVSEYANALYSETFGFNVITYSVKLPPIYLLGDATDAGWDNNTTLEAPYMSSGKYGIAAHLKPNAWLKFIKTQGQWAPMWGSDGTGDAFSGKLTYRPTEDDTDPASIPSPSVEGDYRIDVDITNLTYSVYKLPDVIYLVGGATTIGWDPANGLAFTKDGVGKYSLVTTLSTGNGGMKIMAGNSGAWAPQWGSDGNGNSLLGKLSYRAGDADPDPAEIPEPSSAGTYKIEVDFSEYTYKITKQ
ncbi:SusE domain-containing protein [Maribellus sediminis]|uniref:SusE domain-containing protein n=1 Tax=Maribellus sediminis TaxID=2696285 RepID=UPI0014307C6F|nr:SusE domain-containing protein [Maribellus sediminis]